MEWFTLMGAWCIFPEKLLTVHEVPNFPHWPLLIGPILVTLWFTVGVAVDDTGRTTQTALLLCRIRPRTLAPLLRVPFIYIYSLCQCTPSCGVTRPVRVHLALSLSCCIEGQKKRMVTHASERKMSLSPNVTMDGMARQDGLEVSHLGCQSVNRGCEVNNTPYLKR